MWSSWPANCAAASGGAPASRNAAEWKERNYTGGKRRNRILLERFCTKYKNQAVIFCKLGPHVILDKLLAYGKNTKKRAQKYTS